MKFWAIVGCFFAILIMIGHENSGVLGENIAYSVAKLRSVEREAHADSTLATVQSDIKKAKQREIDRIKKEQNEKAEKKAALDGLYSAIDAIPTDNDRCLSGKEKLTIRTERAKEDGEYNVQLARQWVGYVRKRHCMEMPHENTLIMYPTDES